MKRFTSLMSMLLIVLLLAACSATVGTNTQSTSPLDRKDAVIGAVSHGP